MFTLEVEGLELVSIRFEKASNKIPGSLQALIEETASNIVERAKILASQRLKNPGSYLDSFYVSAGPSEVAFGNVHRAARFIESGTGVHIIEPRTRKVLRFEKEGAVIFAPQVLHPGTQALWILSDAFTEELSGLLEKIREATEI